VIVLFFCFQLAVINTPAETRTNQLNIDFAAYMLDPFEDVKKIGTGDILTTAAGFDYIDVIRLISYQPEGELGLPSQFEVTLELTVRGLIRDHSDVYYLFVISADDKDFLISYVNGSSQGQSLDNPFGLSFSVDAEGSGSDTLKITLDLRNIDNPRESFEWNAMGMLLSDNTNDFQYMDKAPDKILKITKPTDKSTVYNTIEIEGLVEKSLTSMQTVEYQIDSKNAGSWKDAESDQGNYSKWSFSWDTTSVSDDSPHDIYVRGYDGEFYYEDTYTLYVVQSNKDNPETIESIPEINVGDSFDFSSTHDPSYMGIQLEMITDLTETVVSFETFSVDGKTYEVWRRDLTGDGVVTYANIPIDFTMNGYTLHTKDDFAEVMNDEDINMNVPIIGTIQTSTTNEYSPPLDAFEFPLYISEKWSAITDITSTVEMRFSGDYASETSEDEFEFIYEALHTEETDVPAGTFETFVIRTQQKGSDLYELDFYSPELGNVVRIESYDNNNELLGRIDLTGYSRGTGAFIQIENVKIEPAEPRVNDKVKITVDVVNTGTLNLTDIPLVLEVNGREVLNLSVDLPIQQNHEVVFHWTPKSEGNHDVMIIAPNDEWQESISVSEAEPQGLSNLLLIYLVIIIIVIIALGLFLLFRKKRDEKPTDTMGDQSVFDVMTASPGTETGTERVRVGSEPGGVNEPKVIRYQVGLSQVGKAFDKPTRTMSCPNCKGTIVTPVSRKGIVECPHCGLRI
jgi:hypothetical protein